MILTILSSQTSLYLDQKNILREESCSSHLIHLWPLLKRMEWLVRSVPEALGQHPHRISAAYTHPQQSVWASAGAGPPGAELCMCVNQWLPACRENAGEPDSWSRLSYEIPYGDCSVRHHRELDVYTLTSESEAHHEPSFPGDPCTGHIFKLRNIQQQLMVRKKMSSFQAFVPSLFPPVNFPIIRA